MYARDQYQAAATNTAGPAQLVLMLYDGALTRVETAIELLTEDEPRDVQFAHECMSKAQAIINELSITLDHERGGDIATNLAALYLWCTDQLIEANVKKDAGPLASVRTTLTDLRDAWEESCVKGPVAVA